MASTTSTNPVPREATADAVVSCLGWLVLFGSLGALAMMPLIAWCARRIDAEALRWKRDSMAEQVQRLERGEIQCLVQPDPRVLDQLFANADCPARVRELYMGGDLSDAGLGKLRELPNLQRIVLLFASDTDIFLERLQGMSTIEALDLEHASFSERSITLINSFPNLRSLCLPLRGNDSSDLEGIENHPSIESLVLTQASYHPRLPEILQTLPRLRSVVIEGLEDDERSVEESLRQALPNCRCKAMLGP